MTAGPTARTGVVVLLGDPVEHSVSPAIHNAAFQSTGVDLAYLACRVLPDRLAIALDGLWALGARGANVTLPHKTAALALAAEATDVARALGAANTLARTDAGWRADNTDVEGFVAPLAEHRATLHQQAAVVFGAGGAARAVAYACLTRLGVRRLGVVARRPEQAEALVADLCPFAGDAELDALAMAEARDAVSDAALIVNATPLGMGDGRTPWPDATAFRPGQVVYDLVYRPTETPLLVAAASRGATPIGGLPMLIAQAAGGFRQWTGRAFPFEVARRAARMALGLR